MPRDGYYGLYFDRSVSAHELSICGTAKMKKKR